MKRRLFAFWMAVIMLFGAVPVNAFAQTGEEAAETGMYFIDDFVWLPEGEEPTGQVVETGEWVKTEETDVKTELVCTEAEHTHGEACPSDETGYTCGTAEHQHVETCSVSTTLVKWSVQLKEEEQVSYAVPEGQGLPIHFFVASVDEASDPDGDYANFKESSWGKQNGTAGFAYAKAGTENNTQIKSKSGIRTANDESLITTHVFSWPEGTDMESFKVFDTISIPGAGTFRYADGWRIQWVTICWRQRSGNNYGTWCNCSVNYAHIHIDGVLTKTVEPGEMKLHKQLTEASGSEQSFTFTLQRLQQNSDYSLPAQEAIDSSFAPLSLTATVPANSTDAVELTGANTEIGFGYYKVTENTNETFRQSGLQIGTQTTGTTGALYVHISTSGAVEYSTSYAGVYRESSAGATFLNEPIPTTDIRATKVWDDENNRDGIRPASVTLHLLANGQHTGRTATLTAGADGVWDAADLTCTWSGIPAQDASGNTITYTVEEETISGYTWNIGTSSNQYTLTNTHVPESTSVITEKIWNDADNQDGKRPGSIQVQLYADGAPSGEPVTLNSDNHWSYTWNSLKKYAAGKVGVPIVYTVAEVDVPTGYSASYGTDDSTGALTVTNTHEIEKTTFSANKVWNDGDNRDGIRPASVQVQLYANKSAYGEPVTLTAADSWTYTWSALPKNDAGEAITYTVDELAVPDGYTATVEGGTITNTHAPETVDITVSKEWLDANDQDGIRPQKISVTLYKKTDENGGKEVVASHELTRDGDWEYTFADLPKYKEGEVRVEIEYFVEEASVEGYTSSIDGFTITNTHTPAVKTLNVEKVWNDADNQDGKQPYAVQITLYKSGNATNKTVVLTADNNWAASWADMPVNEGGHSISYTVAETGYWMTREDYEGDKNFVEGVPAGYTSVPTYDRANESSPTATVTNSYTPEKTALNVVKRWDDNNNQDGKRPDEVVVALYADGQDTEKTVTLNDSNEWDQTFTDLDKYQNGAQIMYTVKEVISDGNGGWIEGTTDGYTISGYDTSTANMVIITNKHTPETTSYSVTKVWDDGDDQDGVRPTSITLTLHANGVEAVVPENHEWGKDQTVTITLTAGDDGIWQDSELTATWTNLAKYYNGKKIFYSAVEDPVTDYTTTYSTDGTTITNTHTPATRSITVSKIWDDASDQDGIRPQTVDVTLYKQIGEGEKTAAATYTLKHTEDWAHTFTNLPVYEDGVEISYTVEEEAVEGYIASYDGFTITNKHTPATVSISAEKVWVGDSANRDARPEIITLYLYANNIQKDHKVINKPTNNDEVDNWGTVTWTNLPKYAAGAEITYLVYEAAPSGYIASYSRNDHNTPNDPADDVYVVTNTHSTEYTAVTVEKIWNDSNNQDGKRLDAVTVGLYQSVQNTEDNTWSKEELVTTQVLSANNHWAHSFTNLPTTVNAAPAKYTVYEVIENEEDGYTKLENKQTLNDGYYVTYEQDADTGFLQVINTHKPETTSYSVTKIWDDNHDQDGIRPESIYVALYANGIMTTVPDGHEWGNTNAVVVELNEKNQWKAEWTDLDKFYNGKEIVYSAREVVKDGDKWVEYVPDGYTASLQNNELTNTHEVAKTSVTVNKTWVDDNDRDGLRPDSITVQLYANGTPKGEPVTLTKEQDWTYTWTDLDLKANGTEIQYTVKEQAVAGYTASIDGLNITNTHEINTKDLNVLKVWDDDGNRDGKRPYAVQVTLYANGVRLTDKTLVLHEGTAWKGVWTGMPVNEGGKAISYTIVETGHYKTADDLENDKLTSGVPSGYSVDYSYDHTKPESPTATVTNSYAPEKTSLNVIKRWDDEYDRDGMRPYAIQVTLLKNNTDTGKALILMDDNEWDVTFTGLFMYEAGNETPLAYTAVETGYWMTKADYDNNQNFVAGMPEGYVAQTPLLSSDMKLLTLINKHEVYTTGFTATKVWADDDNNDGKRPTSVTLTLHANGVSLAGQTWTSADGKTQYTGSVTLDAGSDGWQDSELSAYWGNLKTNYNSRQIIYSVVETAVEHYTTGYTGAAYADKVWTQTVTNTHSNETTDIPVVKLWDDNSDQDGKRPDSVTVELYANGTGTGKTLTLNAASSWQGTFTDLEIYENGQPIVYTAAESDVSDYTLVGTDSNGRVGIVDGKITLTNKHEIEKTEIKVTKVWNDNNDQDGKRPDTITLTLYANNSSMANQTWTHTVDGQVVTYSGAVTLTAGTDGKWDPADLTYTWANLDKYSNGAEIDYTVAESPVLLADTAAAATSSRAVDRYTESYAFDPADAHHIIITNSYTPETTEVAVMKIWDDMDNRDGMRPDEVTVQLYKNGEAVDSDNKVLDPEGNEIPGTAALNSGNDWIAYWLTLPKYEAGEVITWSIEELDVPAAYTSGSAVHETIPGVTVITNTHESATTSVTVTKIWDDEEDNDGIRPAEIVVQLYANNQAMDGIQAVLNKSNDWSYTFTRNGSAPLYVFEAGQPINYTVQEVAVPNGYEGTSEVTKSESEDVTFLVQITNTHATAKTSLKATKQWRDSDNNDGVRPTSVTLTLYANDQAVTSYTDSKGSTVQGTVTLTAGDDGVWDEAELTYTWVDLHAYQAGELVTYSVQEDQVPTGYSDSYSYVTTASGTEWTVVNAHSIAQKEITVTKKWSDNNDSEDLRPTSITAQLYKNGSAYGDAFVITSANKWTYTTKVNVYENGKEIIWTVRELAVPKYYTVSYNQDTLTITNTIQSKYVADTGDDSRIWFWLGLMTFSCIGTAAIIIIEQKKRRKA